MRFKSLEPPQLNLVEIYKLLLDQMSMYQRRGKENVNKERKVEKVLEEDVFCGYKSCVHNAIKLSILTRR